MRFMIEGERLVMIIVFVIILWIAFSVISFVQDVLMLQLIASTVVGFFVVHELRHVFRGAE